MTDASLSPELVLTSALMLAASSNLPTHYAIFDRLVGAASNESGTSIYYVSIPALSLNYSSRAGNGVMGMGWTLSGLSLILGCPQTSEQGGQTLGAATDRLCLDGQLLVATSGTYGAADAIYHTEVDTYAQVGALTDNTACLRVQKKDGRIAHYDGVLSADGRSRTITVANHSRVPPNSSAPLAWLVEKIEDPVGNNQLYTYLDEGNGEVLPGRITYNDSFQKLMDSGEGN